MRWDEFLALPVFIINLDRRFDERYVECERRVRAAGFTDVRRWKAVDGSTEDLSAHWAQHGSPAFNPTDDKFRVPQQGCFLSYLHLFQHVLAEGIAQYVVFEDDIAFHPDWHIYAPLFWEATMVTFPDLVYLGGQIDVPPTSQRIVRAPCFCTHAVFYTHLAGTRKVYDALLNTPGGLRTNDCCLIDYQKAAYYGGHPCPFEWVCWDAREFGAHGTHPEWIKRNCGLVHQDESYESDLEPGLKKEALKRGA